MNVTSPGFVLGTLIASAIIWHLPAGGPRRWAFSILCVLFLATQMISWAGWCVLAIFLLSGHLMGRWMATKPDGRALTIYLLAIIVAFVYLKNYCFLTVLLPDPWLNRTVIVVGLSYMFFRQIHYLVDSAQGQIEHATFWTYLNYQLHPFGLLAGPIQRFQDFAAYWNEPISILADRHEVLMALLRFFVGILKVPIAVTL